MSQKTATPSTQSTTNVANAGPADYRARASWLRAEHERRYGVELSQVDALKLAIVDDPFGDKSRAAHAQYERSVPIPTSNAELSYELDVKKRQEATIVARMHATGCSHVEALEWLCPTSPKVA